ncbi:MAG: hypothetical protein BGO10_01885 [Chlamydia sp. 32-24]|nr:MAG: hypothetical protein BGO10_01885 [Chlamydia sp. 32-24]
MKKGIELNLSGLPGLTHHYGGLSYGNILSMEHNQFRSNPKMAALQCLELMNTLRKLNIPQIVVPPQERPLFSILKNLGFKGDDSKILKTVFETDPKLLSQCSSSSFMWTANMATVTPSSDSKDNKVHITPANLQTTFHRSLEVEETCHFFKKLINNSPYFCLHDPLPKHKRFSDEGGANHIRFCLEFEQIGTHLFVYGKNSQKFPQRQSEDAFLAIERLHQLKPHISIFAIQNGRAIDAGVFHNDVISFGNQNLFIYHEDAFINTTEIVEKLSKTFYDNTKSSLNLIKVRDEELTLSDAVKTYFFNSQLITLKDQSMALIAPAECELHPKAYALTQRLLNDPNIPISSIYFINLSQSLWNGGGPACLRLRLVLKEEELESINQNFILSEELYHSLKKWIHTFYPDKFILKDLINEEFLENNKKALKELWKFF